MFLSVAGCEINRQWWLPLIPSWSWSCGSWIYDCMYKSVSINTKVCDFKSRSWRGVLDTLCYKICQWLEADWWFSPSTLVSFTNKTNRHDLIEIPVLLKVTGIVESGVKHNNLNPLTHYDGKKEELKNMT